MKKIFLTFLSCFLATTIYAAQPTITAVNTTNPATYDNGDTISFQVIFDQVVNVAGGVPALKFRSPDNLSKNATYVSGTGTNTLIFEYTVGVAPDLNLNDWDGIELEDSSGNPANLVLNGATIQNSSNEDANVSVQVTSFAGIKIDSKAPTWDKVEISSTKGKVNGNTRYLPNNASIKTKSFLTENDTRKSLTVGLKVAGGADQVITYTGSNVNGRDLDAQKTGKLTGDGEISLGTCTWIDQAGKTATGTPNFVIKDNDSAVTKYIMDSTFPVLSFTDDVATAPATSEVFNIKVVELNSDLTTYQYGFSADAVCDDTDSYTLPFSSETAITISDELNNGKYICAKAEDFAGNVSYLASANPLNIKTSNNNGNNSNHNSSSQQIKTYRRTNGTPRNTFGKFKTPAEWKAFANRLRYGVPAQILTYINRNGYEVFAGYRKGLLGWERFEKRLQNEVKYRGTTDYDEIVLDTDDARKKLAKIKTLAERTAIAKNTYQKPYSNLEKKEAEFLNNLENLQPLPRRTNETAYQGILLRKKQRKNKLNKWERHSPFAKKISRDPHQRARQIIKIKLPNNKSVKIEKIMK